MRRVVIVVMLTDLGGVIGVENNRQPFLIKGDLKRFRSMTLGHSVVMGRKTFEAIGKPLPKRRNIILSRSSLVEVPGVVPVYDSDRLWDILRADECVFIIGGGEIYRQYLPKATTLEVTRVYSEVPNADARVFFPFISDEIWRRSDQTEVFQSEGTTYRGDEKLLKYRFETYDRI